MQYFLQKTPVNDLNNPVLLHRSHLIVARQAQPSSEDIRSDIHSGSGYIRIACAR